jgi:hypothetical protein
MEILNHVLGTCGEFHPNIFTLLILGIGIMTVGKLFLKLRKTN